jgi:hypothetical protein
VASDVLLGTTGLVQKVLVPLIVSAQEVCTTALSLALAFNAFCKST